ncbi:zinc finger MYM-type protein 1-like [Brienomyrus brachyistius]|uniref:zinc finger MYM-type protein 1-like n=1 Tax=Brienomyrus brachyistius TaxID=42636 RepID=UPI0020B1AEB3|nr:zinc finger MYM-type protein 1-like [Brienomyrus brachyistius]
MQWIFFPVQEGVLGVVTHVRMAAAKKKKLDIRSFFSKKSVTEPKQLCCVSDSDGEKGSQGTEADQPCCSSGEEARSQEVAILSDTSAVRGEELGSKETGPPVVSSRESSSESDNNEEQCSSGDILHITNKPNQPNAKSIPVQTLSNRVLHFQERWYKEYPWLHYSPTVKGILCFHCVKIYTIQKSTMSKKADPAFCSKGFTNWKNALERFERHQNTKSHHHAVTVSCQEAVPINTQLSTAWSKQQENARHCLQIIVGAVQYLTRQGLALRGHDKDDGNLFQYLKYKAKDDACLSDWLCHCHDYTSPQVQNEILQMLGNSIVRNIAQTIQSLSVLQFSIIIDGTQDISGAEQESICLRYVDEDLVPHEVFIGLYEVSGTTGVEIAKMAVDVDSKGNCYQSSAVSL